MLRVQVLGPVTAEVAGAAVPLGGPRQRAVLARLVAARGSTVSVDRLIEDLWHGEPPARALVSLQAYVSNLRRLLEPGRPPRTPARVLVSAPPGYALRLPEDAVDVWRFERLVRDARSASPVAAVKLLDEALALWRGPAYAAEEWAVAEVARLEELRYAARELRVSAALSSAPSTAVVSGVDVVAEAGTLTRDQPLREEGWRLAALALWRGGRQADALATLRLARETFVTELGLDPGPRLTELERDILSGRDHDPIPGPSAGNPELFVGRAQEADALRAEAVATRGGTRPRVALVTGEAGLGKSALLRVFGQRAAAEGWLVAAGSCSEAAGVPPALAWVQALRTIAATVPPADPAPLKPLLDDAGDHPDTDAAAGRYRLHQAVWHWLGSVARERPVVIVLDDLHWADEPTLALLASLPSDVPVLVVAAFRAEEFTVPAGLARREPLRLALAGLPETAVAELVRAEYAADDPTVSSVAQRSGGNPFFARELARLLASEGRSCDVPEGVRDVLRRRFARLPDAAVAVLRLAALAREVVDVEVLVEAADANEDGVLDALDAGVLTGLLTEPGPGRVAFTHALVRETLVADLSGLRAARMHARLAAALERHSPDDVAALAHHYTLAASSATAAKAVDYGVRAAELAERRYAHDAAVSLLTGAVESFERAGFAGDRDARRVELLGRLLRAQIRAGAVAAARATRQLAIDRAGDREELVVAAFTAWTEPTPWQTRPYGVPDERLIALLTRLTARQDLSPAARCLLLCSYADELSGEGDPRALRAAEEAAAIAASLGDPRLRAAAIMKVAFEYPPQDWRMRAETGSELVEIGERHDLPVYRVAGLLLRARSAAMTNDAARTRQHLDEAARLARAYRMADQESVTEIGRAALAHAAGDPVEAERLYAEATGRMERGGSLHAAGMLWLARITMLLAAGRAAEIEAADSIPGGADLHALALAAAGRVDEARAARAGAGPLRPDYFHSFLATVRAMAAMAVDDRALAAEMYEVLLPHRDELPGIASLSLAMRPIASTLGDLASYLGQDPSVHYTRAVTIAEQWGAGHWAADARRALRSHAAPLPAA